MYPKLENDLNVVEMSLMTIFFWKGRCTMLDLIACWLDGIGVKKSIVTVVVVEKLKMSLQSEPPLFCPFQALATTRNSSAYGVIIFSSKNGLASLEVCKEKYDFLSSGDQIQITILTGRFSGKNYFKLTS